MSKISTDKFILGTVQMGLDYGINNTSGKVSLEDSHEILEYAFEEPALRGYNLDTPFPSLKGRTLKYKVINLRD